MIILSGITVFSNYVSTQKKRLAGHVNVNGAGAKKRIVVLKRGAFEYVASGMSNTDGTWEMKWLPEIPEEQLMVFYIDDTRSFNPIAFDYISLEE